MKQIRWLLLISCFRLLNGFSTTGLFATVLSVFNDTKFHDTQMSTALCITQYRYLQRHMGLTSPEPAMYASCNYTTWLNSISDVGTATKARLEFMYYVDRPDLVDALKNNPTSHFDAEGFISGANYNLILNRQSLFNSIKTANGDDDLSSIRQTIGQSLHTVQDFYSHTNWVEMGMTVINSRIAEDNYLGIALNSPNNPACRQCTKSEMSGVEQSQLAKIENSVITSGLLKLIGFSFDNVFVCRNNILINNTLTSGYYGTEQAVAPKPPWKCSHGGGTDTTADNTTALGGINKDSDSLVFSPHYYLHRPAADLSVLATIRYLEDLRLSLNDEDLFGRIIGLKSYFSIGFVIDTTSSMNSSMTAVRLYVNQYIQNVTDGSIIYITQFNDPQVGPVMRFTNKFDASSYLFSLMPQGGTDGPEMCYDAVLMTVRTMPVDTSIYVFTDATSKNQNLLPTIQQIARQKNIKINYIMTGYKTQMNPSYRPVATTTTIPYYGGSQQNYAYNNNYRGKRQIDLAGDDIRGYQRLARGTGGLFLSPRDDDEFKSLANGQNMNTWETIMFREGVDAGCGNHLLNWTIPIDETISILEVSMVATHGTNSSIYNLVSMFTDFNDMKLHPENENLLVSTDTVRLYRFNINGKPNNWHFYLGQLSCPNGGTFTVNVRAESYLLANVKFIDDQTSEQIVRQPIIGQSYSIYIDCPDCGEVDKVLLSSCGANDSGIPEGQVWRTEKQGLFYVQNVVIPNEELICIEFSGLTSNGFPFTRIHRERLIPTSLTLSGRIYSRDFPEDARVVKTRNATLEYTIQNLGNQQQNLQIDISSKSKIRVFTRDTIIALQRGQAYTGVAEIGTEENGDSLDSVIVSAFPFSNPLTGVSSIFDFTLVDENPDTSAPVCILINSTVSSCPGRRSSCGAKNYSVEFEVTDEQSGLSQIRPSDSVGNWSIPALSQSTGGAKVRVAGTLSCCQSANLVVVDKNGLMTTCDVQVTISSAPILNNLASLMLLLPFILIMRLLQ
ncbi:hypothetical protein FO519_004257 [Halicephalobus sp. NKZ332]|nr:hypothetical protein FO519_004257 [Halicephalobus sp. NKZ332]